MEDKENKDTLNSLKSDTTFDAERKVGLDDTFEAHGDVNFLKPNEYGAPEIPHLLDNDPKENPINMADQWRAQRQARQVSRLTKKTGRVGFSSAIFGTVSFNPADQDSVCKKGRQEKDVGGALLARRLTVDGVCGKTGISKLRTQPKNESRRSTMHVLPARPVSSQLNKIGSSKPLHCDETSEKEVVQKKEVFSSGGSKSSNTKGNPKAPVVRHTLASRMRLAKANPLLGVTNVPKSVKNVSSGTTNEQKDLAVGPPKHFRKSNLVPKQSSAFRTPLPTSVTTSNKTAVVPKQTSSKPYHRNTSAPSHESGLKKQPNVSSKNPKAVNRKPASHSAVVSKVVPKPGNVRRSLSATSFDKKELHQYIIRCQSEPSIGEGEEGESTAKYSGIPSPIVEEASESPNEVTLKSAKEPLKTPKAAARPRKSVAFVTPLGRTPQSSFTPDPEVLRNRLDDWLKKRGKSLESCRHLNCFGIRATSIEQQRFVKPRPQTPVPWRPNLAGMSPYPTPDCQTMDMNETVTLCSKQNSADNREVEIDPSHFKESTPHASLPFSEVVTSTPENSPDMKCVAAETVPSVVTDEMEGLFIPESLGDLRKLIVMGYPRDQCGEWLTCIWKANRKVAELPEYWECIAALQETEGNFSAAITCYENAVARGAETTKIGSSLEALWDKFSALNVAPAPRKTPRKDSIDPKQVFASSIIKFALQQKTSAARGAEANYVVTPVRRSTRKSRAKSMLSDHPVFSHLDEIAPGILEVMSFQSNSALEPHQ